MKTLNLMGLFDISDDRTAVDQLIRMNIDTTGIRQISARDTDSTTAISVVAEHTRFLSLKRFQSGDSDLMMRDLMDSKIYKSSTALVLEWLESVEKVASKLRALENKRVADTKKFYTVTMPSTMHDEKILAAAAVLVEAFKDLQDEAHRLSGDSYKVYKSEFYNALNASVIGLSDDHRALLTGGAQNVINVSTLRSGV